MVQRFTFDEEIDSLTKQDTEIIQNRTGVGSQIVTEVVFFQITSQICSLTFCYPGQYHQLKE